MKTACSFLYLSTPPPRPLPCRRYARKHFPSTRYLDYAITVEEYTLQKAANLVLNGGWLGGKVGHFYEGPSWHVKTARAPVLPPSCAAWPAAWGTGLWEEGKVATQY